MEWCGVLWCAHELAVVCRDAAFEAQRHEYKIPYIVLARLCFFDDHLLIHLRAPGHWQRASSLYAIEVRTC